VLEPRIFLRLLGDAALTAFLLMGAAGTHLWWRAWVVVAMQLLIRMATAVVVHRVHPALLRERAKSFFQPGQPWSDRVLLLGVIATAFILMPIITGLDVFRWHLLPRPVLPIASLGLALFGMGWIIKGLALRANAFATVAVRVQAERQHAVADSGPYAVVRHPFYAATPLVVVGQALWLESYAAALFALVPIGFVVARLVAEDRFLRRELPGYAEYVARVPHRLIPGVW
jgi:protein-S-isoprenylcysteine O-methyltransferase Ste14